MNSLPPLASTSILLIPASHVARITGVATDAPLALVFLVIYSLLFFLLNTLEIATLAFLTSSSTV
jgi:hypothetical protein